MDMLLEMTLYERPTRLASTTSMAGARICGTLTFEPDAGGTRMSWDWDVAPQGAFAAPGPGRRLGRATSGGRDLGGPQAALGVGTPRGMTPRGQTEVSGSRRLRSPGAYGSRVVECYQRAPRRWAARNPSRTARRITQ